MRRLSLALSGSIPSLEEIRRFEARPPEARIDAWLDDLLRDRRCADYLAERFARAFVGTEDGPFLLFRRRRFIAWLSDAILANRPYDAIVRDLIADRGPLDRPSGDQLRHGHVRPEDRAARPRAAGGAGGPGVPRRPARLRQCHDHPFQPWKQADFRGLAAFFGGVHSDLRGIHDGENDYRPADRKTKEPTDVEPRVPFRPELLPDDRHAPRAARRLGRRPAEPEPRPRDGQPRLGPPVRPAAGRAGRRPARRRRAPPGPGPPGRRLRGARLRPAPADPRHRRHRGLPARQRAADGTTADREHEAAWAVFPLTRLRPEQVAGAVFQSASLATLGPQSHWFVRLVALHRPQRLRPPLRRHRRGRVRRPRRHDPPAPPADERRARPREDQGRPVQRRRRGSPSWPPTTARRSRSPTWPSSPAGPLAEESAHFDGRGSTGTDGRRSGRSGSRTSSGRCSTRRSSPGTIEATPSMTSAHRSSTDSTAAASSRWPG